MMAGKTSTPKHKDIYSGPKYKKIQGITKGKGFKVYSGFKYSGSGIKDEVRSRGYGKSVNFMGKVECFLLLLVCISSGLFFLFGFFSGLLPLRVWIVFACFNFFHLMFLYTGSSEERQWHACEHKVINLLTEVNSSSSITLENLKKAKQTFLGCGTVDFEQFYVVFTFFILFLWRFPYGIVIGILFAITAVKFRCLAYPFQYLILRRPTEAQLQESLRVAQRLAELIDLREKRLASG